ncbi:hypothetical protein G7Y79_00046g082070 [Physcia stellaris]|nr:hypothetical protein G7Y79_00046g082070 [Physcia stellaris]
MSAFDDLDTLFSNDLSVDELLARWTNDTDYITEPINDPLASFTRLLEQETQATCGAIDPTRLAYQPLEPLAALSASPSWSNEPIPVPYVPVVPDDNKEQESLFLTPPGSPQATAGGQDQEMGNAQTYVSSYPEPPSLTQGAWPPFAYTQSEAAPTFASDIPIDPALLAEDASSSAQSQLSSHPSPLNQFWTPAPNPAPTSGTSTVPANAPNDPSNPSVKQQQHPRPLPAPLSLLTSTSTIPLKDIPTYISRSPSTRRAEVASKPKLKTPTSNSKAQNSNTQDAKAKIPRPMNSFMLYRYAYAERIAEYAGLNHQLISKVAGESWGMETESVRSLFEEFARVEKVGHEGTWVGYRYVPGPSRRGVQSG